MSRQWDIPKRYVNIKLFKGVDQTDDKLLSNMNVDANINFNIFASYGGMAYEASVTIHGLTLEKMTYLATSFNAYTNNENRNNSIRIDAGFENKHSVIYVGTIVDAIPNVNSADFSIDLRCVSLYAYLSEEMKSLSFEGKKDLKEICQDVAKSLGCSLKYEIDESIEIENYYIKNASIFNSLRDLARTVGVDVWVSNANIMYVKKVDKATGEKKYKIDYRNIIGAPRPDALGCDVAIKMDCTIEAGMLVELESKRFPSVNGSYIIQSCSHSGSTKGNNWQTLVRLTKESILGNS